MNNNKQQYRGHVRRYIHGLAISVLCIPVVALAAITYGIGYLCLGICAIFMMWAELLGKLTGLIYHSRLAPTAKHGEKLANPVARVEQAVINQIKNFKF